MSVAIAMHIIRESWSWIVAQLAVPAITGTEIVIAMRIMINRICFIAITIYCARVSLH